MILRDSSGHVIAVDFPEPDWDYRMTVMQSSKSLYAHLAAFVKFL